MEKTEGMDYFVRLVDFGTYAVKGAVTSNPDGTVNVYINSRLSREKRMSALAHELLHVERDDLYREVNVKELEEGMPA